MTTGLYEETYDMFSHKTFDEDQTTEQEDCFDDPLNILIRREEMARPAPMIKVYNAAQARFVTKVSTL